MTLESLIQRFIDRDPAMRAAPWDLFDELLHHEQPAVYAEHLDAWIVTRRADIVSILHDTDTWSNRAASGTDRASSLGARMMELAAEPEMAPLVERLADPSRRAPVLLMADPPDHFRQRKAINNAFRPSRIRSLEPEVRAVSDRLVAAFAGRGRTELVAEYAVLLPMTMIARALGVPEDEMLTFKRWSDDLAIPIGNADPTLDQVRSFVRSQIAFTDYFSRAIDERERAPRYDVISDVANAEVDGAPLSKAERLGALTQFLVAGNETSTTLITNIGYRLATDHAVRDRVAADRSLVPALVEEALRYEAPVQGLYRQANHDTTIGDVEIPSGGFVWVAYAAGNRDAAACPAPHDFDIDREHNTHLSFGHGEHYCIGASLARLEAGVATNALLDLPNLRLADGYEPSYADSFMLRGITSLDVVFEPIG